MYVSCLILKARAFLCRKMLLNRQYQIAAGLAQLLIGKGINVSVTSNGCDIDTKEQTVIEAGSGLSHLDVSTRHCKNRSEASYAGIQHYS